MQKHLLTNGNREIWLEYPSTSDEMSREEAIYAGCQLYRLLKAAIDADQFRKLMVDKFIRRVNNRAPGLSSEDELDLWANEWMLAQTVNFFFDIKEEEGREIFNISPNGTRMLVPCFKYRLRKWHGPGDFLSGMTISQFKDAMSSAGKFMDTRDDYWLARLSAVCYLRKNEKYSIEKVEKRTAKFIKLDKGIQFMCFWYLMGCLQVLKTDADGNGIEVDGHKYNFSLIFKGQEVEDIEDNIGLIGVIMTLAESGVFGNITETANADVWDVLVRLYQLELQRREMERSFKNTRS